MPKNLSPGQYEIDDLIMGRGTPYKIGAFDIQPYGVAAGDYQIPRQDEVRFGQDQLTPGPIQMEIQVLQNRWLRDIPPGAELVTGDLGKLQRIWRADNIRYAWGEMMPLYYCGKNKIVKTIFGRPGKFTYTKGVVDNDGNIINDAYTVTAEFRRADTLCYGTTEYLSFVTPNAAPLVVQGTSGDAHSWVKILMRGPLNDVELNFGDVTMELDWDIPPNKILEINSYPWSRRAVDSDGINRRANLKGATPYLDRLKFDYNEELELSVTATGTTGNSLVALQYRDAYQVIE